MGKQGLKRIATVLIVALLLSNFGVMAGYAEELSMADKARFTDTSGHWANKYITKMAMLDVIRGYSDGTFRPDNPVTRQEAVLMALRLAGLEDEAESAIVNDYDFEVEPYYNKYVNYAFHTGLLSNMEELTSNGRNNWGASPASREWIAKLTIRTIGETESFESTAEFSDNDEISAWAVGYVNRAAELGIVTGSNGAFHPQDSVTRAELTAFFSRAEPYLEERSSRVAAGTVVAVDSASLTLADRDGMETTYIFAASPALYKHDRFAPVSTNEIGLYDNVFVIHDAGMAYYVEVLGEENAEKARGIYLRSDLQNWTLLMDIDGVETMFELNRNFSLVAKDGSGLDYASLVTGSEIEVSYTTVGSSKLVSRIKVLKVPVNKESTGTVQELDLEEGLLTVHDDETGELEEYALDEDLLNGETAIPYGDRTVDLDQLAPGDEIGYTVDDSVVTEIELIDPVKPIYLKEEATVDFNNTRSGTLYVKTEDGRSIGYPYADEVEVILKGKAEADIDDIAPGDEITMHLDEEGRIAKVEIANRSITTDYMVPFYGYDEVSRTLLARGPDQKPIIYFLTDDTVITNKGEKVAEDQIGELVDPDDPIDITYSTITNELIALNVADAYEGTIDTIDTFNMLLTLVNDQGDELTFTLDKQTDYEIAGVRNADLEDFETGDRVAVKLDGGKSTAASVKLVQTVEYTIEDVNTTNREITVRDKQQDKEKLYIPKGTVIRDPGDDRADFGNLKEGRTIFVTFAGDDVTRIDIPAIAFGRVTAVDEEEGTFTMTDYNDRNAVRTFKLQGQDLEVNDRVYVMTDADREQTVKKLVSFEKSFWKYDSKSRTVYFLKKNLNDKNIFQLHEKAVVRRNDAVVGMSALSYGDSVTGYAHNDTVIELVIR